MVKNKSLCCFHSGLCAFKQRNWKGAWTHNALFCGDFSVEMICKLTREKKETPFKLVKYKDLAQWRHLQFVLVSGVQRTIGLTEGAWLPLRTRAWKWPSQSTCQLRLGFFKCSLVNSAFSPAQFVFLKLSIKIATHLQQFRMSSVYALCGASVHSCWRLWFYCNNAYLNIIFTKISGVYIQVNV